MICTGTTDRMLDALADAVVVKVKEEHERKGRREGTARNGWMVIDYGSIVVHLFDPELRAYYRLEDLWSEGKVILRVQ